MKKSIILSIIGILLSFSFQGCAVAPGLKIPRPWFQVKNTPEFIVLGTAFNIEISGKINPLLGEEKLLKADLYKLLSDLVERRGFFVTKSNSDYRMVLLYNITKNNKLKSSFLQYQGSTGKYYFSEATSKGLGVEIAQAIIAANQSSETISKQELTTEKYYAYALALEIYDKNNMLIWKGDSTWDSYGLNVDTEIIPSLQLMLSFLPRDENIFPRKEKVKKENANNYYLIKCRNNWFTCPALPYKITFDLWTSPRFQDKISLKRIVENEEALEAYIDLILTAEYALPIGRKNYNNPLDKLNWAKVQLGGRYYLGNENLPVNILVSLTGRSNGYRIKKCKIISDDEYAKYEKSLFEWQNALLKMYDIYER